jgi:hypothetical protein
MFAITKCHSRRTSYWDTNLFWFHAWLLKTDLPRKTGPPLPQNHAMMPPLWALEGDTVHSTTPVLFDFKRPVSKCNFILLLLLIAQPPHDTQNSCPFFFHCKRDHFGFWQVSLHRGLTRKWKSILLTPACCYQLVANDGAPGGFLKLIYSNSSFTQSF